jgi:hypothetical protein
MSIKSFKCFPKCSLSEYCNYCRNNIYTMFSGHRITPDALYRCNAFFTTYSDTLYSKLFIPFLIKFDFFVTMNTHTEALCSVEELYCSSRKVAGSRPL